MLKPLSKEWIQGQLAICKAEADIRLRADYVSGLPHPYKYPVQFAFYSAACEGYPLVLKGFQALRKQVRQFLESHSVQYDEAGYWIVGDSALNALDRAMEAIDAD